MPACWTRTVTSVLHQRRSGAKWHSRRLVANQAQSDYELSYIIILLAWDSMANSPGISHFLICFLRKCQCFKTKICISPWEAQLKLFREVKGYIENKVQGCKNTLSVTSTTNIVVKDRSKRCIFNNFSTYMTSLMIVLLQSLERKSWWRHGM